MTPHDTAVYTIEMDGKNTSMLQTLSCWCCLLQVTSILSRLPVVSLKWKVKQEHGHYMSGTPRKITERVWVDVNACSEEECTIQVELNRKSLSPERVMMYSILLMCV